MGKRLRESPLLTFHTQIYTAGVNVPSLQVMLQWENVTAWVAKVPPPPPRMYLQNADGWANRRADEGRIYSLIEFNVEVGKNKFGIHLL